MKICILAMMSALTFSAGAQEPTKPSPPSREIKPPVELTEEMKAAIEKARAKAKANVHPNAQGEQKAPARRVVLPPRVTNSRTTTGRSATSGQSPRVPAPVPSTLRPKRVALAHVPTKPKTLSENITIKLQGSLQGVSPLDVSLTGIGPTFQADMVTGEDSTILTHQYSVKPEGQGYRVEYSIGLRIQIVKSQNGNSKSIEFRDVMQTGAVIAKEGERLVIAKNGAHELSLTVGKAAQK